MEQEILGKLCKFGALNVRKADHAAYEQTLPKHNVDFVAPNALLGIEVEVENIPYPPQPEYYWKGKHDGSLRNNGVEYTSIPLRANQVPYALEMLRQQLCVNNKPDFSPRTSVHVHLNMRDMTWDQVKLLVLLYAVFERHFFHMAGSKREQSIFCVPLYASDQIRHLDQLEYFVNRWHKYNALNLGTLVGGNDMPAYGTVEFRHLYGTLDNAVLIPWINSILCLRKALVDYNYADMKERVRNMNTTSEYFKLYEEIFGELMLTDKMVKHDFEHCITQTKMTLFGNALHQESGDYNSAFHQWVDGKRKDRISKEQIKVAMDEAAEFQKMYGNPVINNVIGPYTAGIGKLANADPTITAQAAKVIKAVTAQHKTNIQW